MEPSTQASNSYDDPVVALQAKNLTKAIFQHESGVNYNAVGDAGTSHGAGQWQPGTWKAQAQDVLGNSSAPMTPENQSVVAQGTIRKLIKNGKNAAQIAAIWNSGSDTGWENKVGVTTINGQRVPYNVPKYVKDVTDLYQQYKGEPPQGGADFNPNPYSNPTGSAPGQFDLSGQSPEQAPPVASLGAHLHGRLQDAATALSDAAAGKINPLSGILQTVGAGAGAIGDTTGAALELVPGVKQAEALVGKGAGMLANTGVGKSAIKSVTDFATANPELSKDVGAVGNIATALPIFKGIGMAKNAIGGAVDKALGKSALDSVVEDVAPILGVKAAAKNVARNGLTKAPISGRIAPLVDQSAHKIAQTVSEEVPGFQQLKTFTDKLNATKEAADRMAEELKQSVVASGKDRLYPIKELGTALKAVEMPIAIKTDPVLRRQFDLARDAALKVARENGGTISSLFDARKAFDQLVDKEFPNLYERANAPMRDAVTGIRNAMNTFIEKKLPEGSGFRESLLKQHRLLKAVENLAPKAVKEIGTTNISRSAARHPLLSGLAKTIGKGAAEGTGIGSVLHLFGQ